MVLSDLGLFVESSISKDLLFAWSLHELCNNKLSIRSRQTLEKRIKRMGKNHLEPAIDTQLQYLAPTTPFFLGPATSNPTSDLQYSVLVRKVQIESHSLSLTDMADRSSLRDHG